MAPDCEDTTTRRCCNGQDLVDVPFQQRDLLPGFSIPCTVLIEQSNEPGFLIHPGSIFTPVLYTVAS
jgi:hypothetical protein